MTILSARLSSCLVSLVGDGWYYCMNVIRKTQTLLTLYLRVCEVEYETNLCCVLLMAVQLRYLIVHHVSPTWLGGSLKNYLQLSSLVLFQGLPLVAEAAACANVSLV